MVPRWLRSLGHASAAVAAGLLTVAGAAAAAPAPSPGGLALGAPASVPESVFTVATPAVVATPAIPAGTVSPARYDQVSVRRFG